MSSSLDSTQTKVKKRSFHQITDQNHSNEESDLKKFKVNQLEINSNEELPQSYDSIHDLNDVKYDSNSNQIVDGISGKSDTKDKQTGDQIVPQTNDCSQLWSQLSQLSNERLDSIESHLSTNSYPSTGEIIPECALNYQIVPQKWSPEE